MVVTVVEDRAGLENIDAIAATSGLDVIFIGTSDLAFSLGVRGDMDAPEVERAVVRIAEAAQRNGKALGRPLVTPGRIREYMQQGFRFFQAPTELGLLTAGARAYLEELC
jgi:2-keto-3-deoxy-L-rhamnonate aldolase RhmA